MKTILHTIDTTGPGGAETIFLNLVEKLTIDGYKNIALIKGPGWVEEQLKKRGIEYYVLKPSGFLSINYYIQLFGFVRRHKVKLVQAHLLGSILSFSIVCFLCRLPLVATLHGQVDINPDERAIRIKQWIMAIGVNQLVAVSKNLAEYIQVRGLFKRKKIEIIYNGIETERYFRTNTKSLLKKLGIADNALLIGSLGNVRPAKNYNLLIEVAALLRSGMIDRQIHFVIAGHKHPKLIESLNTLAKERNVSECVHFIGFYDNTPEFLSQLDIFLLCSSSEGFSIATIEAMAAGVPVIATKCGGPEEIVTHDVNGILVEINNPAVIADAIQRLVMSDNALLTTEAKRHVVATFSFETMILRYREVLGRLL
ncbi:MAG: glycosyltransferase family 4 protein [Fibrobacter sp.]|nr:glycosyltransferase family 4 protein [Fibrobacter sp.]